MQEGRDDIDIRNNCAQCGAAGVTTTMEVDRFPYGVDGPDQVMLEATVPVRKCDKCGFDYTDDEGGDARDAAVKVHLATVGQKRIVNLPPQDGFHPLESFDKLDAAVLESFIAAGVERADLRRCAADDIAEVIDDRDGRNVNTGLTVSFCEIEGKSIARRLLTPSYCLTWVAPGPNDPQDGDDSVEVGEYYRVRDVAEEIVRQIVNYRLTARQEA